MNSTIAPATSPTPVNSTSELMKVTSTVQAGEVIAVRKRLSKLDYRSFPVILPNGLKGNVWFNKSNNTYILETNSPTRLYGNITTDFLVVEFNGSRSGTIQRVYEAEIPMSWGNVKKGKEYSNHLLRGETLRDNLNRAIDEKPLAGEKVTKELLTDALKEAYGEKEMAQLRQLLNEDQPENKSVDTFVR